jgi:undecaprenyl-diphosphatase
LEAGVTWVKAIILGVVQGLTEFLPVSSTGHLVLVKHLMGVTSPTEGAGVLWEVVLHLGTVLAVIVVLRREVWMVLAGFSRGLAAWRTGLLQAVRRERGFALALLVLLGSIPALLVGMGFQGFVESLFGRPYVAAGALLVTGTFLFVTRYARETRRDGRVGWLDALLIGLAQAVAICPGISRSGATISAGLFRGVDRAQAARFSFLLLIPAMAGAAALEMRNLSEVPTEALAPLLVGGAVSAVVGLLAFVALIRVVKAGKLHYFSYYCWALGLLAMTWLLLAG